VCELGLVEHRNSEVEWKRRHHFRGGIRWKISKGLSDVGRAHPRERLGKVGWIAVQEVKQFWNGRRPIRHLWRHCSHPC
jgi:hypothetical protein